ncbi:hypothetical protein ACJIZ3_021561 [Penstemon smallii]|uniref:Uncharacterized protein n=1 Tax=Penstemon smallii TaxID=265156 RepID=A0ABD3SMM2_9LAMI
MAIPISQTRFLCPQKTDYVSSKHLSCSFINRLALSRAPRPLSYTKIEKEEEEEEEEEECGTGSPSPMVMIIYGKMYEEGQRLAFCSLGDAAWTSLHHHNYSTTSCRFRYEDITYFSPYGSQQFGFKLNNGSVRTGATHSVQNPTKHTLSFKIGQHGSFSDLLETVQPFVGDHAILLCLQLFCKILHGPF